MAGSILVSDESALSMSTEAFDYFVDRIRLALSPADGAITAEVFGTVDHDGLNLISAMDLSEVDFRTFEEAVGKAMAAARCENFYGRYEPVWTELVEALEKDPRSLLARR